MYGFVDRQRWINYNCLEKDEALLNRALQSESRNNATELLSRLYVARVAEAKQDVVGQTVQHE